MFTHANVRVGEALDRSLRRVLVTPDLHRVHHSAEPFETDSNLGGILSCWDRLFGTYVAQPSAGHDGMTIGLSAYGGREHLVLHRMLADPFQGRPAGR